MRRLLVVVLVAGLVVVFGAAASAQEASCDADDPYPVGSDPLEGEWILLDYMDNYNQPFIYQLAISRSDGSEIINLTGDLGIEASAGTWSPDGSQIAYVSDESGDQNIWIMDVTGENRRALTTGGARWPAWSPDGTTIAFRRGPELWFVDVRGCDERLVYEAAAGIRDIGWSPDGSAIAFAVWPSDEKRQIYSISVPEFVVRQLTQEPGGAAEPSWSPDGTRIVFRGVARPGSTSNDSIWVMNADGSGQELLFDAGTDDIHPSWSPDGTQLAVTRFLPDTAVVTLVGLSDGTLIDIIVSPRSTLGYKNPVWGPDDALDAATPQAPSDGVEASASTVGPGSTTSASTVPPAVAPAASSEAAPASGESNGTSPMVWILAGAVVLLAAFLAGLGFQAQRDPPPPPPPPPPPRLH